MTKDVTDCISLHVGNEKLAQAALEILVTMQK